MTEISRRAFLQAALIAPAALLQRGGRLVAALPLRSPAGGPAPPLERLLSSSLDARLFTDLSTLAADKPDSLVISNSRFYVRTAAPRALDEQMRAADSNWTIPIAGGAGELQRIDRAALERMSTRIGPYLMECAGNADPANYGLMSSAAWEGAPLPAVLDLAKAPAGPHRVLVTGLDDPGPARTSVPGASWIFSRDDLARAILAVRMNGETLPRDHGLPVRLVVPGWYGCACIKWVTRIDLVPDEVTATTQMREFAARTHQPFDPQEIASSRRASGPLLARDFNPAVIDTSAMPIRIEKWTDGGRVFYRIVGIVWGGSKPTNALSIRFRQGGPWTRVENCPLPPSTLTWSLWTHTWRPEEPGRYEIVLRVDDPSIRTRRLDLFFYVRGVEIREI
jgi:DMSO/TMAO reductase YedYZ molybdopterin-dependent catalytic subunit